MKPFLSFFVSLYIMITTYNNEIITLNKHDKELPLWEDAQYRIIPYLEPITPNNEFLPALRSNEPLAIKVTSKVKMYLAYFNNNSILLLTDEILQKWSVSWAAIQLALDKNMFEIMESTQVNYHEDGFFPYFSVNNPVPVFNSLMPFYKPFRAQMTKLLGTLYYGAIPERNTAIFFEKEFLKTYPKQMRNDILLTYECSTHPLTSELLEISTDEVLSILD